MRLSPYNACVLLVTSGCTVFSPYKTTWDHCYYESLSISEKSVVETQKQFIKAWHGTNKYGDYAIGQLLITKNQKGHYNFTETGIWEQKYVGRGTKKWQAVVKDSIVHDDYGNILYKEEYLDENQDALAPYLFEKWTASNTDSLRQTITSYYPNGQTRYVLRLTVLNAMETITDHKKHKILLDMKTYDEIGKPISAQKLEKLAYYWLLPHISMMPHQ